MGCIINTYYQYVFWLRYNLKKKPTSVINTAAIFNMKSILFPCHYKSSVSFSVGFSFF